MRCLTNFCPFNTPLRHPRAQKKKNIAKLQTLRYSFVLFSTYSKYAVKFNGIKINYSDKFKNIVLLYTNIKRNVNRF